MSVAKGSLLFSLGTLISRLSGVVRESVLAYVFGAGAALDAFFVANRIPNMLRELLAEGALGSSFTKVYTSVNLQDAHRARNLLKESLFFFAALVSFLVLAGIVFAPQIVSCLTLGQSGMSSDPEFINDAVLLTRVLFPFIALMTLGALFSGVLHERSRFFYSAMAPISLNGGYLIGALAFAPLLVKLVSYQLFIKQNDLPMLGLAFGVLLGGFLQTLIQLVGLGRETILDLFRRPWPKKMSQDLRQVLILMGPMIIAAGSGQINVLVNTNFATSLESGAVSWLSYSFRLLQLPIGLFGVAVSTAALPSLTKKIQQAGGVCDAHAAAELGRSCELMLWFMVPCFAYFLLNSEAMIGLLFHHGEFNHHSLLQTSRALEAYSFGVIGYGLLKVMTAFYYAVDRTKYAMYMSLIGIGLNFFFNAMLVETYGHLGLAYTASAVLSFNSLLLLLGLLRQKIKIFNFEVFKAIVGLCVSFALVAGCQKVFLYFYKVYIAHLLDNHKLESFVQLLGNGAIVILLTIPFASYSMGFKVTGIVQRLIRR